MVLLRDETRVDRLLKERTESARRVRGGRVLRCRRTRTRLETIVEIRNTVLSLRNATNRRRRDGRVEDGVCPCERLQRRAKTSTNAIDRRTHIIHKLAFSRVCSGDLGVERIEVRLNGRPVELEVRLRLGRRATRRHRGIREGKSPVGVLRENIRELENRDVHDNLRIARDALRRLTKDCDVRVLGRCTLVELRNCEVRHLVMLLPAKHFWRYWLFPNFTHPPGVIPSYAPQR